jgi:transposase
MVVCAFKLAVTLIGFINQKPPRAEVTAVLKMTQSTPAVNVNRFLIVGLDVDKANLHTYSKFDHAGKVHELCGSIKNQKRAIGQLLGELGTVAREQGFEGVLIAVEPTGGLEKQLLTLARAAGVRTRYVSGEAVCKSKSIESNDSSKTDRKDARIIFSLATAGKTLTVRDLPLIYAQMREVNRLYESECQKAANLKNEMHAELRRQFPELTLNTQQLFGALGEVLAELYGFAPQWIVQEGYERFKARVSEALHACSRRVREKTLRKIYQQAECSALHMQSVDLLELRGERLRELHADHRRHILRKAEYREQLLILYRQCPEHEKLAALPDASDFQLARVIAETGPLRDFASNQQLLRYLGLNLRVRQSGTYRGETKLSKKGRALGRKVLYQLVNGALIQQGRLFHDHYQRKKKASGGCSKKAVVAVMRKCLCTLRGVTHSRAPFSLERVHQRAA